MEKIISIKELDEQSLVPLLDYWFNADQKYLTSLGADISKLPSREDFKTMLLSQLSKPIEERNAYCLIWYLNEKAIGHSNTNPTSFGDHAFMHLHIWYPEYRRKGLGQQFLKPTIKAFFENLKINTLYCQPFAENNAPNKTIPKLGFEFVEEYETVPGSINFKQVVKKWRMTKEIYKQYSDKK